MVQPSHLLTIQKFIFLLDAFHYSQFEEYLVQTNAALPLKLSQLIRKKLPLFDGPEEICISIYGDYNQNHRLAFNQLASYTFKLSGNLALNFPAYLAPNYTLLQQYVNAGELAQADFLSKVLLEISEKIEDYTTQIYVLKFMVQEAFLMKQGSVGVKLSHQLDEACDYDRASQQIFSALRLNLNMAIHPKVGADKLNEFKTLFRNYHKHHSASLRMLSKYASVYTIYYHESDKFKDANTSKLIREIEKDLHNFNYVVFPFAFDLKSNFSFYKLQSAAFDFNSKESRKEFEDLEKHYSSVKFWKSYLNLPEIFTLALRASDYLTNYHHYVHRSDYNKIVPAYDLKQISLLADLCGELLNHKGFERHYKNDLINLHLLHSGLLILSGGEGIQKGADELESMLISYQQVNLAGTADSIFLFLMIAYFAMRQYNSCARTFKRYIRSTKGKTVFHENDKEIKSYYYLSQWLLFKRNQYLEKFQALYKEVHDNTAEKGQAKALKEMVEYFKVPIEV